MFSQTGEYWGGGDCIEGGGDTHQVSSGERGSDPGPPDREREAAGPDWSYLPAPDLGINFVLGDTGCYGRESLVHLAAWKKHMEVDMLRSRRAHRGDNVGRELPFYDYRGQLERGTRV